MELSRKFAIAKSCRSVTIGSLVPDKEYHIANEGRIMTRLNQSVLLAILDSPTTSVNIFLPRRYGEVSA